MATTLPAISARVGNDATASLPAEPGLFSAEKNVPEETLGLAGVLQCTLHASHGTLVHPHGIQGENAVT